MSLWFGVAVTALVIDGTLLLAPRVGVSRFLFAPLGVAGVYGTYLLGVRKASRPSLRSRLACGGLWAAPWILFLVVPWGLLMGAYAWERTAPIRPPDAAPLGPGFLAKDGGFAFGSTTRMPWPAVERLYRERLERRGWRYQWTRELATMPPGCPPGAPLPRWSLFRRFDGLMLVCLSTLPNGQTTVTSEYMHLSRRFNADHLFRK